MNISERIKEAPMTSFQVRAIAICFFLNILDGYDVIVMPLSAPQVADQWQVGDVFLGYLLSASLLGMAFGSFVLTPLADMFGRRTLVIGCVAISALGMLLGMVAWDQYILLNSRVLAGIGLGGMISNLGVIVNEYSNKKRLTLATGIYAAGYPIGATVGGALAGVLIAQWGWREAFILGFVLTVVMLFVALWGMPESYDYLIEKGDEKQLPKLNKILQKIGQEPLDTMPEQVKLAVSGKGSTVQEVFGKGMMLQTQLMWVGYALLTSSFYFANSWTTKIIATTSGDANLGVTTNVLFNLGGIAGSAVFGLIALKIPPRRLLSITMIVAAIFFVGFGLTIDNVKLAMVMGVFGGLATTAGVAGVYMIGPALYPTTARAAGFGWLIGIGRLTSIVAPIIVGYMLAFGLSQSTVFQIFAIPLVIGGIAIALLGTVRKKQGLNPEPTLAARENL